MSRIAEAAGVIVRRIEREQRVLADEIGSEHLEISWTGEHKFDQNGRLWVKVEAEDSFRYTLGWSDGSEQGRYITFTAVT